MNQRTARVGKQDALDRFLESSNPLVRLMLDEVARILRAYRGLRDSRLNDLLEVGSGAILGHYLIENLAPRTMVMVSPTVKCSALGFIVLGYQPIL